MLPVPQKKKVQARGKRRKMKKSGSNNMKCKCMLEGFPDIGFACCSQLYHRGQYLPGLAYINSMAFLWDLNARPFGN